MLPRSTPVTRGPRAHRPDENRTTAHGARARAVHRGLQLWCGPTRDELLPSSLAEARPHGHRIRSAATPSDRPRYHSALPWRAFRAHRPVENRTTAHKARVRTARCRLGCGAGQLATRSSLIRWPRLGHTATASGRRLQIRTVSITMFHSRGARPACSSTRRESDDLPRRTRAHCAMRTWLWCGPTREAFSSPAPWPRLGRTVTASGWRQRLQTVSVTAFGSRSARPARSSSRRESDDRPRLTRAHCAVRAWLWCGPTREACSSPEPWPRLGRTASASGRRLWLQTVRLTAFGSRGARPARSSPRRESDDRPRTRTRTARCGLRLWCGTTRDALLPSSPTEPRSYGHRIRLAAAASNR